MKAERAEQDMYTSEDALNSMDEIAEIGADPVKKIGEITEFGGKNLISGRELLLQAYSSPEPTPEAVSFFANKVWAMAR